MSEQVNTGIASAILAAIALPLPKRSLHKTYHFPTTSDRSFSPQHLAKRPVERSTVDSSPLLRLHYCDFLVCFHSQQLLSLPQIPYGHAGAHVDALVKHSHRIERWHRKGWS